MSLEGDEISVPKGFGVNLRHALRKNADFVQNVAEV